MSSVHVSVVKVGGSLLTLADLPQRLRRWLSEQSTSYPESHIVLITGGGKWVDAIRAIDEHNSLGDERAHWICVALMDVTAGLVGAMLPELVVAETFGELGHRLAEPGVTLLCPGEFVAHEEPTLAGTRLPEDWSVTSDAIAGRLAIALAAEELVLLKSARPPVSSDTVDWLAQLATAGYVDRFLPKLASELPAVKCIDFHSIGEA